MSKAYFFAVILLAGGVIGCMDVSEEDDELIEVLGIDDESLLPSVSLIPALISIGLIARYRRK